MIKRDEITDDRSCLNKASENERLFVLLARDAAAPVAIRAWVAERLRLGKNVPSDPQIQEALDCAQRMDSERAEIQSAQRQLELSSFTRPTFEGRCCPALVRADGYHSEDCPTRLLTISRFVSRLSPPSRESLTWQQLAALFAEPRRTPCTVATCRGTACPHKEGALWSPAVFRGDHRNASDVESISCLAFNINHVTSIEVLREQLSEYQHLLHVTHTNRPNDCCVRIVVQLSRSVQPLEWPFFWRSAAAILRVPLDLASSDIARCYYLPSRPSDADYFAAVHGGKPLDVDATLATALDKLSEKAPAWREVAP